MKKILYTMVLSVIILSVCQGNSSADLYYLRPLSANEKAGFSIVDEQILAEFAKIATHLSEKYGVIASHRVLNSLEERIYAATLLLRNPILAADWKQTHKVFMAYANKTKFQYQDPGSTFEELIPKVVVKLTNTETECGIVNTHEVILGFMEAARIKNVLCLNFDLHPDLTSGFPAGAWASYGQRMGYLDIYEYVQDDNDWSDAAKMEKIRKEIEMFKGDIVITACYDYFISAKSSEEIEKAIQRIKDFLISCHKPIRLVVLAQSKFYIKQILRPDYTTWDPAFNSEVDALVEFIDNKLLTMFDEIAQTLGAHVIPEDLDALSLGDDALQYI